MRVVALILRSAPEWLLVWLERRRAPLGERIAERAWREGLRRWRKRPTGRRPLHPVLVLRERELERLVAAARAGDELAFRRLMRAYRGLIEQQALRFSLPGGDRDDVRQEARLGFAKAVRGYRPERGSFGWFAAAASSGGSPAR